MSSPARPSPSSPAPLIVVGIGRGITAVVVIAVYLTFFPVTIAEMRGLRSPDPRALELMRSYAASRWLILWKVRLPASLPYLFSALKVAATASIVGTIIGEDPAGASQGLGRAIVNFNEQYITGPEKLWATILIASLVARRSTWWYARPRCWRCAGIGRPRHDTRGRPVTRCCP